MSEVFRDPFAPGWIAEHEVSAWHLRERSEFQEIEVFETPRFGKVLALGGVINTSERDEAGYHEMLVHVPLFAHPCPRRVLIIGGGDGGALREVVRHAEVERATLVEIDERVVEVCREHFPRLASSLDDPKAEVIVGDGLAHVERAEAGSYDVILVDSTDPVDAAVELFTPAFYRACARALAPGGVLVPQSDSFLLYPERVVQIVGSLRAIFARVDPYVTFVPTYPATVWTLTFASKGPHPFEGIDARRQRALSERLSYYTPGLHRAAFELPKSWRAALGEGG